MVVDHLISAGLYGKMRRINSWCDYEIKSGRNPNQRYVNVWTNDDGWITIALSRQCGSDPEALDYDITNPSFDDSTIEQMTVVIRNWLSGN